jgi:hypothetical protein
MKEKSEHVQYIYYLIFLFFAVLEMEPRTLHITLYY